MQYIISPWSKRDTGLTWWDGAFTDEELDFLQDLVKKQNSPAQVGNGVNDPNIRVSNVGWLNVEEKYRWVFEKLSNVVSDLNAEYYCFDLLGFGEPIQLTNYDCKNAGKYSWHQDFGSKSLSRKLSVVVQLSHPEDYEGGNLQLLTSGEPTTVARKRGLISVFPAWTLHQVTPVTKGNRQTLVAWITGPAFK